MLLQKGITRFTPIFICCLLLVLTSQCNKQEKVDHIPSLPDTSHFMAVDAGQLTQSLYNVNAATTGVFVRLVDGDLHFTPVITNEERFQERVLDQQPSRAAYTFDDKGELVNTIIVPDEPDYFADKLDFAYFNFKDLQLLAAHSEQLFFSVVMIEYGASIHSQLKEAYYTLKVEGDFTKTVAGETSGIAPMYLLGVGCPPSWTAD